MNHHHHNDPLHNARSIPDLVSEAFSQMAKLVSNEFELAKAEMSEKVAVLGRGAAMIGAGAVLSIPAVVILLLAAAAGLMKAGLSDPIAYLITGVVTAAIAGIMVWLGMSRLSGDALKPSVTIGQVQRDKAAAQEMVR